MTHRTPRSRRAALAPARRHLLALAALATFASLSTPATADFVWSAGNYLPGTTAPDPLGAADVLRIESGGFKYLNAVTLTNHGRVDWQADTLYFQSGGVVDNHGLWDLQGDLAMVYNGGAQPAFHNLGTFRKSAGAGAGSIGQVGFANSGVIDVQTGALHFSGGSVFHAGSSFTGAGRSRMTGGTNSFNGSFSAVNLELAGGNFQGNAAVVNGMVDLSGGLLQGGWTVAAGQTLAGRSGGFKYLSGDTTVLTNQGRIDWATGDAWYLQAGAGVVNQGLFEASASTTLQYNGGALPTFANTSSGIVRAAAGQTLNIGAIGFSNHGGRLEAASGATLNFTGGSAVFHDGTLFTGAGRILASSNSRFVDRFTAESLEITGATQTGEGAVINGLLAWSGGRLVGTWTVAAGHTLKASDGGFKYLNGAGTVLTNQGRIDWGTTNALYLESQAALVNQGLFEATASASLLYNGGALPGFTNTALGTVRAAAGKTLAIGAIGFVNDGGALDAQAGGTLDFNGHTAVFNSGTRFTGAGRNLVTSNARFNDDFQSQNLVLQSGTFTGNAAVANGLTVLTGGRLAGTWTVAAGAQLQAADGGFKYLSGAGTVLANLGRITWGTGDALYLESGAALVNQGLVEATASSAMLYNGGALPTFSNTAAGTLRAAAGQTLSIGAVGFSNDGGRLRAEAGGTLLYNGNTAVFNAGTRFVGAGRNVVAGNASFNDGFRSQNLVLQSGTVTGNAAVLHGQASLAGGRLNGGWTVASDGQLAVTDGGFKYLSGSGTQFTNRGLVAWGTANALYLESGATLDNRGTWDWQADAALLYNGGAASTVLNHGLIIKTGGAGTATISANLGFDNLGTVDVRSGTLQLPANFVNHGLLTGSGRFATNLLDNEGRVAPGAAIGTLTLSGSYVQAATGRFDVQLADPGAHDRFDISGSAALDGTLALACAGSCALAAGQSYLILDSAGALSGAFSHVSTRGFGAGFQYDLVYDYGADEVRLTVLQAGVVPEPGTWALLASGLAALALLARRRRG